MSDCYCELRRDLGRESGGRGGGIEIPDIVREKGDGEGGIVGVGVDDPVVQRVDPPVEADPAAHFCACERLEYIVTVV